MLGRKRREIDRSASCSAKKNHLKNKDNDAQYDESDGIQLLTPGALR